MLLNFVNENNMYNVSNALLYNLDYNDYNDNKEVYIPKQIYFSIADTVGIVTNKTTFCLYGSFDQQSQKYYITQMGLNEVNCEGITEMKIINAGQQCKPDLDVFDYEEGKLYSVVCPQQLGFFDSMSKTLSYEYYIT